jgi:hypothetical protein
MLALVLVNAAAIGGPRMVPGVGIPFAQAAIRVESATLCGAESTLVNSLNL